MHEHLLVAARCLERGGQREFELRVVRRLRQCRLVAGDRFRHAAERVQRLSAVVQGIAIVGDKRERRVLARQRLPVDAEALEGDGQMVMRSAAPASRSIACWSSVTLSSGRSCCSRNNPR